MDNKEINQLLIQELRLLRQDIKELRKDLYTEIESTKKDVNALKTRFMIVAITMGIAGGKASAVIPFLK